MGNHGLAKPKLGKIVITISGPKGSSNIGGVGEFLSKLLESKYSSKNKVDFNPMHKLQYLLRKILGDMPKKEMTKRAAQAFIGLPLLAHRCDFGLDMIKTASVVDSPGRRWIIDTLSDNDNGGFKKEASTSSLLSNINPETVDLINEDGDLLNVITLAKLGTLV